MKRLLGCLLLLLATPSAVAEEQLGPPLLHMPVLERKVEQGILTPVPIAVELPAAIRARARRVLLHYRVWGDPDWTTLELRSTGKKHTGAIPCLEVSTITGDIKYYFRVHDADGALIAQSGSRAKPYRVTVKHDTVLGARANKKGRCPDPADGPRGLPGCPSIRIEDIPCRRDADCEGGSHCGWRGYCELTTRSLNRITLGIEQDIGLVSTTGACSVASQESEGYACFRRTDGASYVGKPVQTNEPMRLGKGPTRVVVGYERVLYYDTSVGVRAGWAFAGEGKTPRFGTQFVPWSFGLRASHWFGHDPFSRSGFHPYVFVTAGYAMFDIETSVHVREDPNQAQLQGGNDLEQTLDAWKRAGDGFAGLGGGVVLSVTPDSSVGIELSVAETFPFGATILSPSLFVMQGF
jgi:hypothetical protein